MDPHLRSIKPWTGPIPSELEAYNLAKDKGYFFPNVGSIGSLTEEELEAIASHPPKVKLGRWLFYRSMNKDSLLKEFPSIRNLLEDPTKEDLFYYATRGWIPEYDSIEPQIKKLDQYNDLSDIGKSLIDSLYGNSIEFATKLGHPLEKYILEFDKNLDSEAAVRSLGERIGMDLPPDEPAAESFYSMLLDHIEKNEHGSDEIRHPNRPSTREIINEIPVSEESFSRFFRFLN